MGHLHDSGHYGVSLKKEKTEFQEERYPLATEGEARGMLSS
jgi:hypothetical protein